MQRAIMIGAGNIGRGFIGALLAKSGYQVLFADVNQSIIDAINENHIEIEDGLDALYCTYQRHNLPRFFYPKCPRN